MADKVATLQKSGVGMVTTLRKVEEGLHVLSTKDLFWKVCIQELLVVSMTLNLTQ